MKRNRHEIEKRKQLVSSCVLDDHLGPEHRKLIEKALNGNSDKEETKRLIEGLLAAFDYAIDENSELNASLVRSVERSARLRERLLSIDDRKEEPSR